MSLGLIRMPDVLDHRSEILEGKNTCHHVDSDPLRIADIYLPDARFAGRTHYVARGVSVDGRCQVPWCCVSRRVVGIGCCFSRIFHQGDTGMRRSYSGFVVCWPIQLTF